MNFIPTSKEDNNYIKSGRWKCKKSKTGAHHWFIIEGIEKCKYCDEERTVSRSISSTYRGKRSANTDKKLWS